MPKASYSRGSSGANGGPALLSGENHDGGPVVRHDGMQYAYGSNGHDEKNRRMLDHIVVTLAHPQTESSESVRPPRTSSLRDELYLCPTHVLHEFVLRHRFSIEKPLQ